MCVESFLEAYLQLKVKRLSNLNGSFCQIYLFRLNIFYCFSLPRNLWSCSVLYSYYTVLVFPTCFEGISQNEYLYKWKPLLNKLAMWTHNSYLTFYCNSSEKQFLKGVLVRKCHHIMIRGKFRTPSNISDGAFIWK